MCNTFRPQKKQSKAYEKREIEMEIDYFIKIKKKLKTKCQKYIKNGIVTKKKKSEKNFKTRVTQTKK